MVLPVNNEGCMNFKLTKINDSIFFFLHRVAVNGFNQSQDNLRQYLVQANI